MSEHVIEHEYAVVHLSRSIRDLEKYLDEIFSDASLVDELNEDLQLLFSFLAKVDDMARSKAA